MTAPLTLRVNLVLFITCLVPHAFAATDQPMQARPPIEYTSGSIDVGRYEGRSWTDFNGDGKADYCRVVGSNGMGGYVRCTPSNGRGFDADVTSFQLDAGVFEGRAWADFNGDGKADYFRIVEVEGRYGRIKVTLSKGARFGAEITSQKLDFAHKKYRGAVDFDGDGKSDYCWLQVGNGLHPRATCILSLGDDFGQVFTSQETGDFDDATWADVNGDRKADFCRVVGRAGKGHLRCSTSTGTGFGEEISITGIEIGARHGRAWPRFAGTKRTDYCRIIDNRARCTFATGRGFGGDTVSDEIDAGFYEGRAWPDYNGDNKDDYCRVITKNGNDGELACTPSTGEGFGTTVVWGSLDAGRWEGRGWADFDGDGKADYCRVVGNNHGQSNVRCTLLR